MKKIIAIITVLLFSYSSCYAGLKAVATNTGAATIVGNYASGNDAAQLPHLRKCMSNVKTSAGGCRILVIGDSTTQGWGTQGGGSDIKSFSWVAQAAKRLQASFPSARVTWDSFMGDSATNYNHSYDPRFTAFSGAFTDYAGGFFMGGLPFQNTGATGTMSYKPVSNWDTAKIWYITSTGNGTFGYQIDSGSTSTQSTNAAAAIASVTATAGSPGNHQLNITYSSGSAFYILGVEFSDSTHPGISFINAGSYGSTSSNWVSTPVGVAAWSALSTITAMAPDACMIDLDLNDQSNSISVGTYTSNISSIISTCAVQSDVILLSSNHGTGTFADSNIQSYVTALEGLAYPTTLVPIIKNWEREVSYTFQNTAGWMYDNVHLNAQGYADFAETVTAFFIENFVGSTGSGTLQAVLQDSKSTAVNNITIATGATGVNPSITAQGSDTNVGIAFNTQGTGGVALKGSGTNDSAAAGYVGEEIAANASSVSQTTATPSNVTSISVTAGDWLLIGSVGWAPSGVLTNADCGINTTSATLPAFGLYAASWATNASGGVYAETCPSQTVHLSATTTYYLVQNSTFTGTETANGYIKAIRLR